MQIHHLAVNALLKYNLVNEMEGDTLLGFGHEHDSGAFSMNDQNGFDEFLCTQRCLTDTVTSGTVYADSILQHLYRWLCRFLLHSLAIVKQPHKWAYGSHYLRYIDSHPIVLSNEFLFCFPHCSPKSKLHDPTLHQLLHKVNNLH